MLDDRSIGILKVVLKRKSVSMGDLIASLTLSQRQINYSLEKINEWLDEEGLPHLTVTRNKMYTLSNGAEVTILTKLLGRRSIDAQYVLNSEERQKLIFLKLFVKNSYLSLYHFISELTVSRSTVLADMKSLKQRLAKKELSIGYNRETGYYLKGKESVIRYEMMAIIMDMSGEDKGYQLINHCISLNQLVSVAKVEQMVSYKISKWDIQMIEKKQSEFAYMFIFLLPRLKNVAWDVIDEQTRFFLRGTKEYHFSRDLLRAFAVEGQEDTDYVTGWLLGISVGDSHEETADRTFILTLVEKMINRFEALTGTRFINRKRIVKQIFQHLRPVYYRLFFKLPIINPLTAKIRAEYSEFYQLMITVMKPFNSLFNEQIPDGEIAFLTLHFASFFFSENDEIVPKKRAIVICPSGIGSSVILRKELQTLLPELDFIDQSDVQTIKEIPREVDIIFSTVATIELLTNERPMIVVSPIMSSREKYQVIQDVYAKLGEDTLIQHNLSKIMAIINKHIPETHASEIEEEIYETLMQPQIMNQSEGDGPLLSQIINEQLIQLNVSAENWEEAIREAAQPLLQQALVTQRYIDGMIETTKEVGPYIVITKHVALPHARPELGAKKIAISIATLATPIAFGNRDNDPVKYIFCLSAKDSTTHLNAMAELVELLERSDFYQILDGAKEPKDVYDYIINYEEER